MENPLEHVEKFTTSRGSKYFVLPDGRTRRFKTADGTWKQVKDITLFVPDYNYIKKYHKPLSEKGMLFVDFSQFAEKYRSLTLQQYFNLIKEPTYFCNVSCWFGENKVTLEDVAGREIVNREDAIAEENLILASYRNNELQYKSPVFKAPYIGFQPFEIVFKENGGGIRLRHLGHLVTDIIYKNSVDAY